VIRAFSIDIVYWSFKYLKRRDVYICLNCDYILSRFGYLIYRFHPKPVTNLSGPKSNQTVNFYTYGSVKHSKRIFNGVRASPVHVAIEEKSDQISSNISFVLFSFFLFIIIY
jgi:hypothetical protein